MTVPFRTVLIALAAVSGLAACDSSETLTEKAIEKYAEQQGVDMDVDLKDGGQSVTMKSDQGEITTQVGGEVKIPDGFPSDIPVYDGLTVHAASTMSDTYMLHAQSAEPLDKIVQYYVEAMPAQGWVKEAESNQAGVMYISSYKKDGRTAGVTVVAGDDSRTVQISALGPR
ncbi:hypothetical protein [Iodidimonas sp. SYSU 1G8]|uniref:hypothetical protein n=1 Tax=Iodidimonas sp. SYSU 1G8 TaxID=3133967 RepID=UPI0031FF3360